MYHVAFLAITINIDLFCNVKIGFNFVYIQLQEKLNTDEVCNWLFQKITLTK